MQEKPIPIKFISYDKMSEIRKVLFEKLRTSPNKAYHNLTENLIHIQETFRKIEPYLYYNVYCHGFLKLKNIIPTLFSIIYDCRCSLENEYEELSKSSPLIEDRTKYSILHHKNLSIVNLIDVYFIPFYRLLEECRFVNSNLIAFTSRLSTIKSSFRQYKNI